MRGSIVVLALAISPFVARVSMAQQGHLHVRRHDFPAAARNGGAKDKQCEERRRGNPSDIGRDHRADPRYKGNKNCPAPAPPPAPDPAPSPAPAPDPAPSPAPAPAPAPAPDPAPAPAPTYHTSISGYVFFDLDGDGLMGPDENGLAGWTVQATGPMSQTAVTDGNGQYLLSGLVAGQYTVCVLPPAGWNQVFPGIGAGPACATGVGYTIDAPDIAGDVLFEGVDFGFVSAHW